MKKGLLIFFTILLYASCSYYQKPISKASPPIRILLYQGNDIVIKPYRGYVISISSRKEAGEGIVYINLSNKTLYINDSPVSSEYIEIIPTDHFQWNGRKYPGLAIIVFTNNSLYLINQTDIETYLKGVLPNEVSPKWDMEALKAQAIVSRTYALYETVMARKNGKFFDVYADTRSQLYSGLNTENQNTSLAIESTLGEVIRYDGKVIPSFFHSSSGGMTEAAIEVYGNDWPYLKPVESPYCSVYRDNKWETSISLHKLQNLLRITNRIQSISVIERTESKRIKTIEIQDNSGCKTKISGINFRDLIGPTIMKSTRANIYLSNDLVLIKGMGYGHGVGMGQWDALGMAKQGFSYKSILSFFYRGISVDRMW